MRTNKSTTRHTVTFCTAILILTAGCSGGDLSRSKASELLNTARSESMKSRCSLNPLLEKKPEFKEFVGDTICRAKIVVTGIQRDSDSKTIIEAREDVEYFKKPVEQWLNAFSSMESRLLAVDAKKTFSNKCKRDIWQFIDTSDGQTFFTFANNGVAPSIKDSYEWKQLQKLKKALNEAPLDKMVDGKVFQSTAKLFDDGWRLDTTAYEYSVKVAAARQRDLALFSASSCID